ncbi:MAG TPA: tetratricopeptide repeat protein [Chthoniobacterales bacterium]|nr:tetratricopeptide repeat protein [Chthoniobacterales bacterium]
MSSFFDELKRRKVYRVAVAYVIAAGGIIQLASAVFPAWELPDWSLRLVIVLLLIGFPIALILAWAFDVTPTGIQATPALSTSPHRRRNVFFLGAAGLVVAVTAGFFLLPHVAAKKVDKSIAVLPFENLSEDKDNAFFADGIQDDILTNLSKIGDLKVISRTSVMGYRGQEKNVRQIGKELGVSAILEGSVRREGNRVRVNVQLINAENDQHLWAEDYDRDLTDVFAIQTDLAQKIARELQAQLSPSEEAQMTRKPTENGEAYLAFVEAHNLQTSLEDRGKLNQAAQLYERAIQLDPKFVLAIANLSIVHSWVYHNFEPTDAERDLAKKYADRALELAPDSPEAHLAGGFSLYYGTRDYEGALRELRLAQVGLPNDAGVYLLIGAIQRRQGKWKESTANLEKAVSLDPNDTWPLQNLFFNYQMQRDFEAANRVIERALAINPKSVSLWGLKAQLAINARGDLTVAQNALAKFEQAQAPGEVPKNLDSVTVAEYGLGKANILTFRRKYPEALAGLRQIPQEALTSLPDAFCEARLLEGILLEKMGQGAEARVAFSKAKESAEAAVREAPNEASRHAKLGRALAYLGEKEAAITEAKRATELLPESVDAFSGPGMTQALAEVYMVTGDHAKAIELVDGLLSRPGELTVAFLKIDPILDRLRDDPEFQKVLAKHEAKS